MATACDVVTDLDHWLVPLAGQRRALVPVSDLAELWGLPADEALDVAAELEAEGWLSTFDPPDADPCVILSTLAAERLGIELEPPDSEDLAACRWVRRGESRPSRSSGRECLECDLSEGNWLDSFTDDRAEDPGEMVAALDDPYRKPERWHISRSGDRTFLVLGLRPVWPVQCAEGDRCPGCGGIELRPGVACVICDRCGKVPDVVIESPAVLAPKREAELAGGRGRGKPTTETAYLARPEKTRRKTPPGYRIPSRPYRPRSFDLKALRAAQERGRVG